MRISRVNWMLFALLSGFAGRLAAGEIPVYRAYTQPIQMGDGKQMQQVGPDREALKNRRDTKAREGLMGKETLVDLGLESGDSVFKEARSVAGMDGMCPTSGRQAAQKKTKSSSEKNWLAGSLTLPSLGQSSSNTAQSAISGGDSDSSWGWLAAEVVRQSGEEVLLPEDLQSEEDLVAALSGEIRSERETGSPAQEEWSSSEREDVVGAFTERESVGMANAEMEMSAAPGTRAAWGRSAEPALWGQGSGGATEGEIMSRTRELIADWSLSARPDFSSWRQDLPSARSAVDVPLTTARDVPSLEAGSWSQVRSGGWGGSLGGRDRSVSDVGGWSGGWQVDSASPRTLSSFGTVVDPVPVVTEPRSSSGRSSAIRDSGGYKPAWY